jgi:hypothetical protein
MIHCEGAGIEVDAHLDDFLAGDADVLLHQIGPLNFGLLGLRGLVDDGGSDKSRGDDKPCVHGLLLRWH